MVTKAGIPQCSVLRTSLFLVYINDLPERLTSNAQIFADGASVSSADNTLVRHHFIRTSSGQANGKFHFIVMLENKLKKLFSHARILLTIVRSNSITCH